MVVLGPICFLNRPVTTFPHVSTFSKTTTLADPTSFPDDLSLYLHPEFPQNESLDFPFYFLHATHINPYHL